ncbi:hypothetical protein Lgee_0825 [Legionella geestiana]|uniref:Uncharacterized protein n=1 Tax=Legionella geestiana TaxID=45065 RepID=A0A0W0U0K6_9GAMM|nr:hypothetical protein [Legionella geestiana]KTD01556.1 hypothetical protein Lgee_0825 [Legionella geestiana]QBS12204.1 hypothetical protein E4T54_05285 [Legionella geestiana]STX53065.1 Uncharacterised protein [Legionella geestiana]
MSGKGLEYWRRMAENEWSNRSDTFKQWAGRHDDTDFYPPEQQLSGGGYASSRTLGGQVALSLLLAYGELSFTTHGRAARNLADSKSTYNTIEDILDRLQGSLRGPLYRDGDLYNILHVLKEKTGKDYLQYFDVRDKPSRFLGFFSFFCCQAEQPPKHTPIPRIDAFALTIPCRPSTDYMIDLGACSRRDLEKMLVAGKIIRTGTTDSDIPLNPPELSIEHKRAILKRIDYLKQPSEAQSISAPASTII